MAKDWSDYFAAAYGSGGFSEGMKMGFEKWKQEKQLDQFKQVYGITPEGDLGVIGQVPKGSQVVVPPSTQIDIAQKKSAVPTADMKNALVTTKQSKALVDSVIKQSESLKGGYRGMGEIAGGAINRGKGESAKYRTYLSTMPATAVSIYRAVTGDTRLSDADAQARAYPLLWHPSEHEDVRGQKNSYIKSMILAREALLSSGKYTTDKEGNAITDLPMVAGLAERILEAKKAGYDDEEITAYFGGKNGK